MSKRNQSLSDMMRERRARVMHPVQGQTLAQQQFKGDTDVNRIAERSYRTGVYSSGVGRGMPREARFLDLSGAESYHDMLNRVTDIQQDFMSLPASVRKRFSNDPYQLLRWIEDPKNKEEAMRLGLIPSDDDFRQAEKERKLNDGFSEQLDVESLSEEEFGRLQERIETAKQKRQPKGKPVPPEKDIRPPRTDE